MKLPYSPVVPEEEVLVVHGYMVATGIVLVVIQVYEPLVVVLFKVIVV